MSIENRSALTGRWLKEDDSYINVAELLEEVRDDIQVIADDLDDLVAGMGGSRSETIVGYEKIAPGTTVVQLTSVPLDANGVIISIKQDVRFTGDGTTPTQGANGEGFLLRDVNEPMALRRLGRPGILALKFIRGGGSNATLYALYLNTVG